MSNVFEEIFLYWTGKHFKSLPTSLIGDMKKVLLTENVPIKRVVGLEISTALAQYVDNCGRLVYENRKMKIAETLRRVPSNPFRI